jgi:hypothetical protein
MFTEEFILVDGKKRGTKLDAWDLIMTTCKLRDCLNTLEELC